MWEHFAHGSDIGIRGRGASLDEAFAGAACALTAVVTEVDSVVPSVPVAIHCEARDDELLLVDWIDALIYEMATRHMVFRRFDVQIEDHRLTATAWGEPVDILRHHPAVEPKGATMTALLVRRDVSWLAQTVVDV